MAKLSLDVFCRWECGLLEVVDNQDIGRMATLAYRIMAKTGNIHMTVDICGHPRIQDHGQDR